MMYREGQGIFLEQRSRKPLFISVGAVVVCVIIAVIVFMHLSRPVTAPTRQEQIKTTAATSENANFTPVLQPGRDASFDYPAQLRPVSVAPPVLPVRQNWSYISSSSHDWQLVTSVENLPEDSLSQETTYVLWRKNPARYPQQLVTINGQTAYELTDTQSDGFNRLVFLPHGGLVGTVALEGSDDGGDQVLQKVLTMVLQSWHWR